MPDDLRVGYSGYFTQGVLQKVLAEVILAAVQGSLDHFDGFGFADCQEPDRPGIPPTLETGTLYSCPDIVEIRFS